MKKIYNLLFICSLLVLFLSCSRESTFEIIQTKASFELKFPEKINLIRSHFSGKITIGHYKHYEGEHDYHEVYEELNIADLNIVETDHGTYKVVEPVEVPFGETLLIDVEADLGEHKYLGNTSYFFEANKTTSLVIYMTMANVPNEAPYCFLAYPESSAIFTIGEMVNIYASAYDNDGIVEEVSFYINNELMSTATTEPFEYNWNTAGFTAGTYELKAIATDDDGAQTESIVNIILE